MKYSICLMTIAASLMTAIEPGSVSAEGLISQVIYPGGYSSTTIYVPFGTTTTTTTTNRVITGSYSYPDPNAFSSSTTIYNGGVYYTNHRHHQFQQHNIYRGSRQSNCSTSIIASPIPSPIPLDRYTGSPCR